MNTDTQTETGVVKQNGEYMAKPSPKTSKPAKAAKFAKGSVNYWKGKLFKNPGATTYSCRMSRAGRREYFSLNTSNGDAAASKAKQIHDHLIKHGMDATRAKFMPKAEAVGDVSTVGDWIKAVNTHCLIRSSTFQNYVSALCQIAGEIGSLPKNERRFNYKGGGTQEWREAVNKLPLSLLNFSNVNAWQVAYRGSKPQDALSQRRAKNSARAIVRNAKSLFGEKGDYQIVTKLRAAGLSLPEKLPFSDVSLKVLFGKALKSKYTSKIDASELIRLGAEELPALNREAYKVFVLGLFCGLRKGEIDRLLWEQVDLKTGVIHLEVTEMGEGKNEESEGGVDLDPELLPLLRGWRAATAGDFVVEGKDSTDFKSRVSYRCEGVYAALNAWLRQHGVKAQKPLHELRKEAGALVAQSAGIYAASRLLRHSDIRVTADFYADKKQRISTGLGSLLPAPANVIEFPTAKKQVKAESKRA